MDEGKILSSTLSILCNLQQAEEMSSTWESCPCPSPTVALRKKGPAPHLGITVELTLVVGAQESHA